MKVLELHWNNIMSYGNKEQSIKFSNGELWQITGKSGAGKSVIMILMKLLFFGKTDGVKPTAIANRINKNGWIKGVILVGNNTYVIERGFSPSSLSIYKNNVSLERAGLKNMQEVINNEVLEGLPYHIFSNVLILSLNNFKSFISMSPADKRLIIDKIFSLEIINKVHEMIKKDMKELGQLINNNNSQIFTFEQMIEQSNREIEELDKKVKENNKNEIEELNKNLKSIDEMLTKNKTDFQTYSTKKTEVDKYIAYVNSQRTSNLVEIDNINKSISLFNSEKCPTCGTPFKGEYFDELKVSLDSQLNQKRELTTTFDETLKKYNSCNTDLVNGIQTLSTNINKLTIKKTDIVNRLKMLSTEDMTPEEYKSIQNIINSTLESKIKIEEERSETTEKFKSLEILETLYGSEGIKRNMMVNYLPTLNKEIYNTLEFLSFPYTLEFDNNFDPHLKSLGEDILVETLSAGEHKKVDLAVLCSMIKMIKQKYNQINLVCLDETLSSLDSESSTDVIKYLKEISHDLDMNILIVSHTVLDESLFDHQLEVTKNLGFSDIKEIKL